MGAAFGSMEFPCWEYELVDSGKYEIRTYGPCFVAEIKCDDEHITNAFLTLQKYAGVSSTPENRKAPPVEPTGEAPAGVAVPISLTFPILQQEGVLQIILPREYLSIDQVPVPTNSDVTIRSIPSRVMAVHKFYGRAPRISLEQKRDHLVEMLQEDSLIDIPTTVPMLKLDNPDQIAPSTVPPPSEAPINEKLADAVSASSASTPSSNVPWILARYHHQSTLPAFRRKEIWIELDPTQTGVAARIEKHQTESSKLRGQEAKDVPPLSGEKASPAAPVA